MSTSQPPAIGTICWTDLTVPDAAAIRDFYQAVAGWTAEPEDMSGYSDFNMYAPTGGDPVAGICHAQGVNADIPPQWLIYIVVADVDQSAARAVARGGAIVTGPREMGTGRCCVVRDPAGAVCMLYQP